MTAKEFVKSKYPNARSEKQISGIIKGMQSSYWLIRDGNCRMYLAEGKTEAKAWKATKELILRME